jgi:branched-chain amino acid transport system substrate-binding protein
MQVSLCTVTSGPGAAVSPLYKEDSTFAITPSGSSLAVIFEDPDNMTGAYGNVVQMCFTDPNQGVASADYLSAHKDLGTKVGIIYKNDDNYSTGIYNKFVAEAQAKGLEVVYTGTFAGEDNDFNVQLTQAQSNGADILFLPIYYQPASTILKQANDMGYKVSVFGVDGMDGILSMEGFDTSLAEGVFLLTPFSADATDDLTKNFVANYQQKYGEIPNQFAADAYDAVYAIAQALEAAGANSSMSNAEICSALVGQFTSMTFNGLTGSNVTWNTNGEVSKAPKAVVIQNGVYVGVEG